MYSTRTRVHARIPNGHPRDEKRASDKSPRTSQRAGHADFRARILCTEVSQEVRVGVGVRVGPVEFKLYQTNYRIVVANTACHGVALKTDSSGTHQIWLLQRKYGPYLLF